MYLRSSILLVALLAPSTMPAQQPILVANPSALRTNAPSWNLGWNISGPPQTFYMLFADVDDGPVQMFGQTIWLGLTPSLSSVISGTLGISSFASGNITVPVVPGVAGRFLYLQHVHFLPQGPLVGNGDSVGIHRYSGEIIETFYNAVLTFTGNFDVFVKQRLQGAEVRRRVHRTIDPQGIPFPAPLVDPLNHFGARTQIVFRPQDLGASGDAEQIVAIRWRPLFGAVWTETFENLRIEAGHTTVQPDYTIDPFTALPAAPNSGLNTIFQQNMGPGGLTLLFAGNYDVRPSALTASGYVPYPAPNAPFEYNGTDSLLLDIKAPPEMQPRTAMNGQTVRLMVSSSPRPNARVAAGGSLNSSGNPVLVDPFTVTSGRGDNSLYDYEIEFLRVRSTAESQYYFTGAGTDYHTPMVASHVPAGASMTIEYRGSDSPSGTNATGWSTNVDVADGRPFLQFRVEFVGDPVTGAVPSIDTLIVPIN